MERTKIGGLAVCLLLCSWLMPLGAVRGATITAASAALADVQTAVNAANAGDTVKVPAGSATWASAVSIRKNISVIGAGTNLTVITCAGQAATIGSSSAGICRLSGIRFNGSGRSDGIHLAAAPSCRVRVDHCWLQNFNITFYAFAVGVVDHCTVVQCGRFARASAPSPGENPTDAEQQYVWNNWVPMNLGTSNAMFFEACHGIWSDFNNNNNILFTTAFGGGYIVRNCQFDITFSGSYNQFFDAHGNQGPITAAGAMRGTYALGIYNNTFNCSGASSSLQFALIRSGSGLIFSNIFSGSVTGGGIDLYEEDAGGAWGYTGPPYYDPITNLTVWANRSINVGYYDTATANIVGKGVYWSSAAPAQIVTLPYPHPIVTAQDGGGSTTNPVLSVTPTSLNFGTCLVGSTNVLTLTVQNAGTGTLSGNASVPASSFTIKGNSAYSLAAGQSQTISVQFVPPQTGVANQSVTLTGGGGASVPVTGQGQTTPQLSQPFNSTQGQLSAPFSVNVDGTISQAVETVDPTQGGEAIYAIQIPATGNYVVSAQVLAPDDSANSMFINFDSEPTSPDMIWDMPVSAGMTNCIARWRLTGAGNPKVWSLSAGMHQLIVRGREANVKLGPITVSAMVSPPTNLRVAGAGQ